LEPVSGPPARSEFQVAIRFVEVNGYRSFWYFTLARRACIPFSLLGVYVCYRWARELYGPLAGLLVLGLWYFSANIIAQAQLVTPDAGATALGVAAAYCLWRWLRRPRWPTAFVTGFALGLAELAKTTWIVLFALWPLLWLLRRWPERRNLGWKDWRRQALQIAGMLLLSTYVLNLGYGFEGSFRKLGDYQFASRALGGPKPPGQSAATPRNRFSGTWLGRLPVPLPNNYVQGIDQTKHEFEQKKWSYFRGEWRLGGWSYYYLYALAIKVPLGTWVLVALGVFVSIGRRGYSASWRDELLLLAPLVVVLTFVRSQTGYSHHLRYVLPIFPFAFIWVSKVARAVELNHRKIALLAGGALLWSVTSSLWIYPQSLSYFNESVGGPRGGHAHLDYSNIDWSQDLLYLKRWLDKHPEARPLGFAYSVRFIDPSIAGIECSLPPVDPDYDGPRAPGTPQEPGPLPGWYAMSVQRLIERGDPHAYFWRFQPAAMAGYSIYIYHITLEDANRVRREFGLRGLRDAPTSAPAPRG
jgi:4-amino-4-deoxy-L-arabinose transferase-like glycosyltransferase